MNRLPPEVIAPCVAFVCDGTDLRPIVSLTHVCRYWRRAIVSSPWIWASIDSRWKWLTPLYLERAGSVPLTVRISVSSIQGDVDFLKAFLPHTTKIAHLSLTGYSSLEGMARDIPSLSASLAPNLVSLELEQTEEPTGSFPSYPLFQNVSGLKLLRLTRTPLHPLLMKTTSLLELNFSGCTTPFRFEDFIEILRSNPSLERIALDIRFSEVPSSIIFSKIASLPRLLQLSFNCSNATDAKMLILSISFPRGVSLEFSFSQASEYHNVLSFLPSPPTTIQGLLDPITIVRYETFQVEQVRLSGNDSLLSFRCNRQFSLDSVFHLFNTASVRELHVGGAFHRGIPLSQLPALETLVIVDVRDFRCTFDFLAEDPVPCPSLKTIAFLDCNLSMGETRELGEAVTRRKSSTAAWLHRVVVVDRAGRLPNHDMICQLRQFVPRVDVSIDERLPDLP